MTFWGDDMSKIKMVIPKQNSPISAIRHYCTECSGGARKEISECPIYRCPLFPYRFGMMPDTYIKDKENEVQIIDEKGKVVNNVKRKKKESSD